MRLLKRLLFPAFLILLTSSLFGDAIVVNRSMFAPAVMEMDIRDDRIVVQWEIESSELTYFADIVPDEIHRALGLPPESWASRLARFMNDTWPMYADGRLVTGYLESVEGRERFDRDPLSGEVLAGEGSGIPVLVCTFVYPLENRPDVLDISGPPLAGPGVMANVGFLVSHRGIPASEFSFLAVPERLILDWDDPWYSRYTNRNLTKAYNSPVNLFMYVESREIRIEIIVRPSDLGQWIDLGLESGDMILPEDRPGILEAASGFLEQQIALTVDGQSAAVVPDRVQFLERSRRGSFFPEPDAVLDPAAIYIGAVFVTPVAGLPGEVRLPWNLFAEKRATVSGAAVDEAGPLYTTIIPEFPYLSWTNVLTNPTDTGLLDLPPAQRPVMDYILIGALSAAALIPLLLRRLGRAKWNGWPFIAAALAAAALVFGIIPAVGGPSDSLVWRIPEEDRRIITRGILTNIYRAFDYREDEDIYDALATSARGDILQDLYLDTRGALEIRELGGARVKVTDVEVIRAVPRRDDEGSWLEVEWSVTGSVGHWGHVHQRTNGYSGDILLDARDGVWKMSGFRIRSEERIR